MRVIKCDACQTTYEPYPGNEQTGNANGLLTVNFDRKGRYDKQRYIDLCPDCARKLNLFLHGEDLATIKDEPEVFPYAIEIKPGEPLIPTTKGDEYEQEVEE